MTGRSSRTLKRLGAAGVLLMPLALAGCLGEPGIEERWSRVDIVHASTVPGEALPANQASTIDVRAEVTYRRILTGFAVFELRASPTLGVGDVELHPNAPRLRMAQDIDRVLQNSYSLGRATRAVTGWDHLIQEIDLSFDALPPSAGAGAGLFLVCYLGAGMEVERPDGSDSLVVTPFVSTQAEILPVGMELSVGGGS